MYLMVIRPQRQAQKKQLEMIAALKPGDEVITAGGLYGDIVEVMDDRVSLEISEDIEVEVAQARDRERRPGRGVRGGARRARSG